MKTKFVILCGLSLTAFVSAMPGVHASASSGLIPVPATATSTTSFTFNVDPNGPTDLTFLFSPGSGPFVPAEVTASNLSYNGNFIPDYSTFLSAPSQFVKGHVQVTEAFPAGLSTISLYNNGPDSTIDNSGFVPTISNPENGYLDSSTPNFNSSVTIPFQSLGTSGSFDLAYFDAPTTSNFSLLQGTTPIIQGTFGPAGTFTSTLNSAPGGTGSTAVPEPSPLALLGLGVVPLLLAVRRRAARA